MEMDLNGALAKDWSVADKHKLQYVCYISQWLYYLVVFRCVNMQINTTIVETTLVQSSYWIATVHLDLKLNILEENNGGIYTWWSMYSY